VAGGDGGNPQLPAGELRIALPPDADLGSVSLALQSSQVEVLPGSCQIAPAPLAATSDGDQTVVDTAGRQIVGGKNVLVYASDAYYGPACATLVGTEQLGRWKMAVVEYSPFQYDPVTGSLRATEQATVTLNYRGGDPLPAALAADAQWDAEAAGLAANYAQAAPWYAGMNTGTGTASSSGSTGSQDTVLRSQSPFSSAASGDPAPSGTTATASYVIITTSAIQANSTQLANFVAWKQEQGYTVAVETESAWGGGSGDTAANNIHHWLAANYVSMGIQYVLLIGDPTPSTGNVPMKMMWPGAPGSSDPEQAATDYYYAALTTNWDANGDGYYGEWGSDVTVAPPAEVAVGRIPVYGTDYADLDSILAKTVSYESSLSTAWRKSMLLPMGTSNYANEDYSGEPKTDGTGLANYIQSNIATPGGYSTYTLFEQRGVAPVTESCNAALNETNVVSQWSSTPYGIVDWWGHGNDTGAYSRVEPSSGSYADYQFFTSSDTSSLNNNYPSIVTQVSCENGVPGDSSNLGYALLKNGAVATYAASADTWYAVGSWAPSIGLTYGDNASYAYYMTQQLTATPFGATAGAALQWARQNLGMGWGVDSWMNALATNLDGDPSLQLFPPAQIHGTVVNDLNRNGVRDAGEPGLSGWTVFLDQNNNGVLDSGTSTLPSGNVNQSIPYGSVTSSQSASGIAGDITKVTVTLNANQSWDSDLTATLISPEGTQVQLFSDVGGSGQNFTNTTFNDAASTLIASGTAPFTGSFQPQQPLSALIGQNPNGTWQLQIVCDFPGDVGTLLNWTVNINYAEPSTTTDANGNYTFTNLVAGTYDVRCASQSGWVDTNPASGAQSVTVSAGQIAQNVNFLAASYSPPVAVNDAWSADENTALSVPAPGVLLNDTDPQNWPLTAALVTSPAHGSLTLNPNGSFLYTPAAGYTGPDSFSYQANDADGSSNTATVSLTVNPLPTAANHSYVTDQGLTLSMATPGVLLGATGSGPLTAVLVGNPSHGTLSLSSNGSFVYTPAAGYTGPDSFTYQANDGIANSNTATVSLAVNPLPVAAGDSYVTDQGLALSVAASGVLGNDTGSGPLTAVLVGNPSHGTLSLNANGSFLYTPTSGYTGTDSFTYQATDGLANSNTATVTITVNPLPAAVNHSYVTDQGLALSVVAPGVLLGDTGGSSLAAVLASSPLHGTLTLQSSGSFLYTPATGYTGTDSFTYQANDGITNSSAATVSITVNPLPVAANNSYVTDQGVALNVAAPGVLLGDTGGSSLTAVLVASPVHGTLTLHSDGSFLYTPATAYTGTDSFTYQANDGLVNSNTATVSITVNPLPVAVSHSYVTDQGMALSVTVPGVLANATGGGPLTAVLVTNPLHGTLSLNSNGSFLYTPTAGYTGTDSFTYQANDGLVSSTAATVTITVNPLPVVVNESYVTDQGLALNVAPPGVLLGATAGGSVTAILVTGPAHGSVALNPNGSFLYTPAAGYSGTDSFTYQANDGLVNSNTATVSITVNPLPAVVDESYITDQGLALSVAAPGVLLGATAGGPLTAALVASPSHGTLTLQSSGSFLYTPAAGYTGTDSFTYQANDGLANSNTATVSITVNPLPVAANQSYVTDQGVALSIAAPGVLANATGASPLTAVFVGAQLHGTLALRSDGSFLYTPTAGYTGTDSFTYQANDGVTNSNTATVTITVNPLPVANADSYVTDKGVTLNVAAAGVLTNDTGSGTLTATLVANAAHGTVTLQANGAFSYVPTAGYTGSDSFTYQANDGIASSNTATVTITVNPLPVANADSYVTDKGVTLSVAAAGVLANDTGSGTLTATLVASASHGTVTLQANGAFSYVPTAGYTGTDSFTYQANDGVTNSNTATVTITVNPLPVANVDSYVTDKGVTLNVAAAAGVLSNDTGSGTLTATLVANAAHGTVTLQANGAFSYVPTAGFTGTDSFSYQANDGVANSNTATVTITVNPLPVANADSYVTDKGVTLNVAAAGVLSNDTGSGTLTATLVANASHGTVTLQSNGAFSYVPTAGYTGTDSFTYQANDGIASSNTATVTITVNPLPVANADSYVTDKGVTLDVAAAAGVLANDTGSGALTATLVANAAHGTVTLQSNGAFSYVPTAGYTGSDSFTYQANDGIASSNTATVSITVNPLPVAANQTYLTDQGVVLSVAAPGVLTGATAGTVGNSGDNGPGAPGLGTGAVLTAVLVSNPSHGALSLAADGSFLYTPAPGYTGPDSFTYEANDGIANSNTATVSITVNPLPVAANDTYVTDLGVGLSVAAPGVLGNDAASGPLTAVLVSGPAHGMVTLQPGGSFLYTPAAGYTGADSFTYQANDGVTNSNTATVSITVNPLPVAANDSYVTDQGLALSVAAPGVLGNDTGTGTLTTVLVSNPLHGTLSLNPNGSFLYTPAAGYTGTDSFTCQANDGVTDSNTATVTITVNPLPTAANESYVTDQGVPLSVAAPGVLVGATGSTPLTAVLVASPLHGTLTLQSNGSFLYAPASGYTGPDNFTYQANDGVTSSNTATVSITVNPLPVAANVSYVTDQGLPLNVAAPGVLVNDTASSPLAAVLVSGPGHGTLTLRSDGSFLYTPATGYSGTDSFTYQANDGIADSNTATVSIAVNLLPVVGNKSYVTDQGITRNVAAPGVLCGAKAGSPLTAVLVSGPGHGTLTLRCDGSFLYTPAAGYTGPDSFTYQANDGIADSNIATVSITVNPLPVAASESYTTDQGLPLNVASPGVLFGATAGSSLTAVLVTDPGHGTLTLRSDGSFLYTPAAGYSGLDSFAYQADDGVTNSNTAMVSITVNPLPTAANGSYSTDQGLALSVAAPGVLVNAAAGSPLTAILVSGPGHGTLALHSDGSFLYTPAAGYTGTDSFTYQANDGLVNSNTATVSITVNPLPVVVSGSYVTDQGVALSVAAPGVLVNATAGGPLTAVLVTGPGHGTLALQSDGSFAYTPAAGYTGSDSFTYQANDGIANSNTATVSIAVNPLPAAGNESYVTDQDIALRVAAPGVLVNATASSPLTAVLVSGPAHGTLTLQADGSFLYTPAAGYTGPDSFTYQANDGIADSNTATISIAVNPLPAAVNEYYVTDQGQALNMAAPGVLGTGVNAQGYPLTAVLVASPAYGSVVLNPDGSFLYTPAAGYSGPDSFTYQASDGVTSSNTATVSITVIGLHTMTWQGSGTGNWTDAQWTGAPPAYPDITANVVLDVPDSVQVNAAQAANSLQISSGGQVLVAAGGSLAVTTDTGVTTDGVLNVNPAGGFSTGGTFTLDTGGSASGGSISAAAFQLNDGIASADLSGPGGLTKDTSGTVTLCGTNTYSGGTTVKAGLLLAEGSGAIPNGSLLAIGSSGSVVLGEQGYAELGLGSPPAGAGVDGSLTTATAPSSGFNSTIQREAAAAVAPTAVTVSTAATSAAAPATVTMSTATAPVVAPAVATVSTAAAVATSVSAPAVAFATSVTPRTSPARSALAPSTVAAHHLLSSSAVSLTLPSPRAAAGQSKPATRETAAPGLLPSAAHPIIASVPRLPAPAQDEVLRAGNWAASLDEVSWLDDQAGLDGRARLAWKPDSVARAADLVLAGFDEAAHNR
jgi:autotransporter-associated beta strand protein